MSICHSKTTVKVKNKHKVSVFCFCVRQALVTLESRLKLLSGETGLSVEQKIAEVQDSVRKAKVQYVVSVKIQVYWRHSSYNTRLNQIL